MADVTTVVEGKIKFREGKKWKPRWCVMKKPSPVADRLQVILYKDVGESVKEDAKPKSVFCLDAFFGLNTDFNYDKETHVLAIVCHKNITFMAFEQREKMIEFEINIRQSLGEERQFPVNVVKAPSNCKLPKEQLRLMIHDLRFCLVAQNPPKLLLSWNIEELRRFGARDGKFCFEGGTRCGKGSGVFALQSEQAEDIEEIMNSASTGKMSNCHRKFKNRSSQIDLGTHLIRDMSPSLSSSSIHHHQIVDTKSPPLGALPVTLNCCHDNQTGSADSEDWSWYKRHSVSVMDHHRIAALREKNYPENGEHLMGIYDVPPNHGRKLEETCPGMTEESNYSIPRRDSENLPLHIYCSNSVEDYGNYKRIVPKGQESDQDEKRHVFMQKRQSVSAELFDLKVSNVDEMVAAGWQANNSNNKHSREESLQRLKMQESDLHREMVLLDEILLNCSGKSQEMSNGQPSEKAEFSGQNMSSTLLSGLDKDLAIISGNITPLQHKLNDLSNPKKADRITALRLNTSMPEGTPLSPIFHTKLNNIPITSRLNAPLPYVNLSKYDDESKSHVYLPGSADCIPASYGANIAGPNIKHERPCGHSSSLTCLNSQAATASLINLSQAGLYQSSCRQMAPGQRSQENTQAYPEYEKYNEHQEILFVKMDPDPEETNPIIYASLQCMAKGDDDVNKPGSELVSVLTADVGKYSREEKRINQEDLYENLPARKASTPPPELPPKGPALLKKLNACSNSAIPSSAPSEYACKQKQSLPAPPKNTIHCNTQYGKTANENYFTKEDAKEDNYCMMGSPKIQHKRTIIPDSPLKLNSAFTPTGANNKCKPMKTIVNRCDYMDMATLGLEGGEDEIYLDVVESKNDLYISEADLKFLPAPNVGKQVCESTYMEMSSVSNRKSVVMQNLETLQTYVSKTTAWDSSKPSVRPKVSPPPPPPYPPRPMSLKVKHSGTNAVESKPGNDLRPNEKPVKSPTKVYTKAKKSQSNQALSEPPMPFPNLIEFTKKMGDSRSTYVNTLIDNEKTVTSQESYTASVPLPEPVTKEGFLARFKRRSSKDKNAGPTQEKPSNSKNRNSVLERSMSEHETSKAAKEEKTSKLKLGRRRSSSFPNRLSYQESLDGSDVVHQIGSSSSSFSSGSSKPKPQTESSSSILDDSDDSDMSPLLKRGEKKVDPRAITILHVQWDHSKSLNPYMQINKSPNKPGALALDSSKTDDEKLIDMIKQQNTSKKPVIYQRSSSLELKQPREDHEQGVNLKLPLHSVQKERRQSQEKLKICSSLLDVEASNQQGSSRPLDISSGASHPALSLSTSSDTPPSLPPKTKLYQALLSPVIETSPSLSFMNEPLYVELDEILPVSCIEGATNMKMDNHRHYYEPIIIDEEEQSSQKATFEKQKAGRFSLEEPRNETPVSAASCTLPLDILPNERDESSPTHTEAASPLFHRLCDLSSSYQGNVTDDYECISPAKTILRPRAGKEYVVIQRRTHYFDAVSNNEPNLNEELSILSSLQSSQELSPTFSSMADTTKSCQSLHSDPWEKDNSQPSVNKPSKLVTSASKSPVIHQPTAIGTEHKTSAESTDHRIFFPMDLSFNASPPPSPTCPSSHHSSAQQVYYPIYVNQEFIPKPSTRTVSTSSSHSSASPIRTGVQTLMSFFFSPKQNTASELQTSRSIRKSRSRNSESDAPKLEKHSVSLPMTKVLPLPVNVHRSHSDPRRTETGDSAALTLAPEPALSSWDDQKVHKKEYDKFAQSSIISRRRLQCPDPHRQSKSNDTLTNKSQNQSFELASFSSGNHLQIPLLKSSGYKNIDTFNALGSPAPTPQTAQIPEKPPECNKSSETISAYSKKAQSLEPISPITSPVEKISSISCIPSPPLPIPIRRTSSSTPPSSQSSPCLTPSDISDSPPSYFAPSPPPPALPPRQPLLLLPCPASPSSHSESELESEEEEQELNYIEVDMRKTPAQAAPPPPPVTYTRQSKRIRQQKEKDYSKSRYVLIDHRATKALQQARQEHVQSRDGPQTKSSGQLNRINSTPSSSKRKHLSFIPRERKLSSGSVESC